MPSIVSLMHILLQDTLQHWDACMPRHHPSEQKSNSAHHSCFQDSIFPHVLSGAFLSSVLVSLSPSLCNPPLSPCPGTTECFSATFPLHLSCKCWNKPFQCPRCSFLPLLIVFISTSTQEQGGVGWGGGTDGVAGHRDIVISSWKG